MALVVSTGVRGRHSQVGSLSESERISMFERSKTIRYRPSLNHKLCRLEIGGCCLSRLLQHLLTNQSLWVPGGVWSQG